jgi:hypothetical protein
MEVFCEYSDRPSKSIKVKGISWLNEHQSTFRGQSFRVMTLCSDVKMEADGPPKRWYPTATLHGVTTQKTVAQIFTAVECSNLTTTHEGVSKRFRIESITKHILTTINTRWEATQRVMVAKFTRLTHKITIQLQLVAESCTICSSPSRWPVRKLLDTPSY